MKYIKLLVLICAIFFSTKVYGAHQLYADMDGITIPYGTKLELQMAENITTKSIFSRRHVSSAFNKRYLCK